MNAYDEFFKENPVKLHFNKKAIRVDSIATARSKYLSYIAEHKINSESQLLNRDGILTVEKETIAVFSISGDLYNTDEELIDEVTTK